MSIDLPDNCPYCGAYDDPDAAVLLDEHWAVVPGPHTSTRAGALKVVSRRHLVDFHELDDAEATSFGVLLRRLDDAVRRVTGAERVHLVSTRDRVPHFHAWLYPRYAGDALRGTAFLDAPQSATSQEAVSTAAAIREALTAPAGS